MIGLLKLMLISWWCLLFCSKMAGIQGPLDGKRGGNDVTPGCDVDSRTFPLCVVAPCLLYDGWGAAALARRWWMARLGIFGVARRTEGVLFVWAHWV